jgi:alcohol dehydrogenase class IV
VTLIRRSRTPSLALLDAIAVELGIHSPERSPYDTQMAIADEIERIYKRHGMPTSLRELNVPKEDFEAIARDSVKIFNSNAGMRDEESHMENAIALLEAACCCNDTSEQQGRRAVRAGIITEDDALAAQPLHASPLAN